MEEKKLTFKDFNIVQELTTFISRNNTFAAEDGCNDDLAMCMVIFAWVVAQDYFREMTDNDVRKGRGGPGDLGKFIDQENVRGINIGRGLAETLGLGVGDEAVLLSQTMTGSVNAIDGVVCVETLGNTFRPVDLSEQR